MRSLTLLALAALIGAPAAPAAAEDARTMLVRSQTVGTPRSSEGTLTMTLTDDRGRQEVRSLELRRLGNDRQLSWFVKPTVVRGTAFLRVGSGKDRRMWLYMPAFKKLERIAGAKENESFLGSDFTYNDMGDRDLDAFRHTLLPAATLDGRAATVVQSDPLAVDDDAVYGRIVTYLDAGTGQQLGEDIYDPVGDLFKQKRNRAFQTFGAYSIPTEVEMLDVQNNHRTRLKFDRLDVDKDMPESMFTSDYVLRLRP